MKKILTNFAENTLGFKEGVKAYSAIYPDQVYTIQGDFKIHALGHFVCNFTLLDADTGIWAKIVKPEPLYIGGNRKFEVTFKDGSAIIDGENFEREHLEAIKICNDHSYILVKIYLKSEWFEIRTTDIDKILERLNK